MKTTIYDLLGMIKDDKAPKKIIFKETPFEYDTKEKDYYFSNGLNKITWLFDEYVLTDILNDEVEILETTYKPDKIEKIDLEDTIQNDTDLGTTCKIINKINEIIDRLNNV